MNDRYLIFIDFDGTITSNDVGYELFKKFSQNTNDTIVQAYRRGDVNSLECLSIECEIWNSFRPNTEDVYSFLDAQKLRPGFIEFLKMTDEWKIHPLILSEGFNFYIDRILNSHGLANLEKITNLANFENGILTPKFPYNKLGCDECSNCKGYHIRRIRPPASCAIFIGDGHSDFHAAQAADLIFARSHLEELLTKTKRGFFPYDDFYSIANKINDIIESGLFAQSERLNFYRFSERHRDKIRALWESGDVMRYVGYPHGLGLSQAEFNSKWPRLIDDDKAIRLALEDKSGRFMGEAMIAFPNSDGFCEPDVKLLPEFWGKGLAYEAWQIVMERTCARWPQAHILVTPNVENQKAINLYKKLGFEFEGEEQVWQPPLNNDRALAVRYRRMVKKSIAINRLL